MGSSRQRQSSRRIAGGFLTLLRAGSPESHSVYAPVSVRGATVLMAGSRTVLKNVTVSDLLCQAASLHFVLCLWYCAEFKHGRWQKKVKIVDLIPVASVSKEVGLHSYVFLLKLSVTVPWQESGGPVSSETEVDVEQVDESGFDMEIFEQEDDNLQVEEFLFEVEVVVREPYHMAVAVGLMRGSVCILKRDADERVGIHCPVFDRLRNRVGKCSSGPSRKTIC